MTKQKRFDGEEMFYHRWHSKSEPQRVSQIVLPSTKDPQVITPPTCSYIVISCLTSIKQISLKHRTKEVLLVIMHGDRIKGV